MTRQLYAPNPYALAQRLTGERDISFLYAKGADWKRAYALLQEGLHLTETRTLDKALALVRKMASTVPDPIPLEKAVDVVMGMDQVKEWGFSRDEVRRVLPLVMPIADSKFGVESTLHEPQVVASYKRVDRLVIDGTAFLDPIQGAVGDCYLISSMIALAWTVPERLEQLLNPARFDARADPSFSWKFHNGVRGPADSVKVKASVPMDQGRPRYARSIEPTEYWPGLLEKAYVKMIRDLDSEPQPPDYQMIANGDPPQDACRALVGGSADLDMLNTNANLFTVGHAAGHLATASGVMTQPAMVSTMTSPRANKIFSLETGLRFDHAYAVLGVIRLRDKIQHVVIRDPYGVANEVKDGFLQEEAWQPEGRPEVELNQSGVMAITGDLFFKHFKNIGWVKLE